VDRKKERKIILLDEMNQIKWNIVAKDCSLMT